MLELSYPQVEYSAMVLETTTKKIGMSLEEFNDLQAEQPFELLYGERIDKMPNPWIHSWIIRFIFRSLDSFVFHNALGEVFQETTYAEITEQRRWVKGSRIPDVMFFSGGRVGQYLTDIQHAYNLPFGIVPDVTIEVLSASEKAVDVNRKVAFDLEMGVRIVWIVDPVQKAVIEYSGSDIRRLVMGDHLDGRDVLPGFQLALNDIFSDVGGA